VGKSLVAGALALREALLSPGSLVLILSRVQRQSKELFQDKLMHLYNALGRPLPAQNETALQLKLANGSRVAAVPGSEATIRGFSNVALLVIDEAARVPDELYRAVRPMLAVSGGRLVCLSSAWARSGFFFEAWTEGGPEWERVQVTAAECSRIRPEFLDEERRVLGARIYQREYECVFSATDDAVFAYDSVLAAMVAGGEPPLF
jgi:hypothetical protein